MTSDDVLAYLFKKPKSQTPTELKGPVAKLHCWLNMRKSKEFHNDVIVRHGLQDLSVSKLDSDDELTQHAVGNAWGHCMQCLLEKKKDKI